MLFDRADIFSSQMSPLFLMKQLGAVQKLLDIVVLSFQQPGEYVSYAPKVSCRELFSKLCSSFI